MDDCDMDRMTSDEESNDGDVIGDDVIDVGQEH